MIKYKEKYDIEKRKNTFLVIALIILTLGFLFQSFRLEIVQEQSEDLCYLYNKLTGLTNDIIPYVPIELGYLDELSCYSGNAERRLE